MKLIFGVFITGLLAVTMVFSQQSANPAIAGDGLYSQTVARQADANSLILAARALHASLPAESENWGGLQPGSMAANVGSPATEHDFYNETIAIEAHANSLVLKANKF